MSVFTAVGVIYEAFLYDIMDTLIHRHICILKYIFGQILVV